jgi:hypothetical protein
METEVGPSDERIAPPYMPFKTFTNLLVRMAEQGVPRRIDPGYLNSMSGGTRSQLMAGLKWLGLLGKEDRPTDDLKALVEARDRRPQAIADLFRAKYDWALTLAGDSATQDELDKEFRARGSSGSTTRKASAFFLQGALYAGLPTSPFFKKSRTNNAPRRRKPGGGKPSVDAGKNGGGGLPPKPELEEEPDATSVLVRRQDRLFDALLKKLDAADGIDADLVDRLERIAGTMPHAKE